MPKNEQGIEELAILSLERFVSAYDNYISIRSSYLESRHKLNTALAPALALWRKANKLTQVDAAEILGCDTAQVCRAERIVISNTKLAINFYKQITRQK